MHPEIIEEDLLALEKFIFDCENILIKTGQRLLLDLRDLTFIELPSKTIIDDAIRHDRVCSKNTQNIKFIKCNKCNKLILSSNIHYHIKTLHSPELKINKNRNWLPRYSQAREITSGYSVQGGAPGLGKRK
jgi:hypothetical protein